MKKRIKISLLAIALGISAAGYAKSTSDTLKVDPDRKIEKTAKKAGNKTAEVAAKGAAAVVDKKFKDKVGPNGEVVYIDNRSRYYYINSKGARVFVPKGQLKDKPHKP